MATGRFSEKDIGGVFDIFNMSGVFQPRGSVNMLNLDELCCALRALGWANLRTEHCVLLAKKNFNITLTTTNDEYYKAVPKKGLTLPQFLKLVKSNQLVSNSPAECHRCFQLYSMYTEPRSALTSNDLKVAGVRSTGLQIPNHKIAVIMQHIVGKDAEDATVEQFKEASAAGGEGTEKGESKFPRDVAEIAALVEENGNCDEMSSTVRDIVAAVLGESKLPSQDAAPGQNTVLSPAKLSSAERSKIDVQAEPLNCEVTPPPESEAGPLPVECESASIISIPINDDMRAKEFRPAVDNTDVLRTVPSLVESAELVDICGVQVPVHNGSLVQPQTVRAILADHYGYSDFTSDRSSEAWDSMWSEMTSDWLEDTEKSARWAVVNSSCTNVVALTVEGYKRLLQTLGEIE